VPSDRGEVAVLHLAVEQAPVVLCAHEPGRAVRPCGGFGLVDLARAEVRVADLADHPRVDQLVERPERLGDRHVRVGRVELVEVDHARAEAAQASRT
jgi:hypothetical protein